MLKNRSNTQVNEFTDQSLVGLQLYHVWALMSVGGLLLSAAYRWLDMGAGQ